MRSWQRIIYGYWWSKGWRVLFKGCNWNISLIYSVTPPTFECLFCSILFSHLTTPSRFTAIKKWKFRKKKVCDLQVCHDIYTKLSILCLLFWAETVPQLYKSPWNRPIQLQFLASASVMEAFLSDLGKIRNRIRGGLVNTKARSISRLLSTQIILT